jgi:propanol-preferring alcohol dehydrogenase
MKAAVVHRYDLPLSYEEIPVPRPGPGQVQVRIETSGLCHTDIHAAHGDWPVKPSLPFVPGHEGVGIVTELGAGVTSLPTGTRVAIPWLGSACGRCEFCISGWETLCPAQSNTGYSVNGGHAEFAVADAAYVGRVPAGIDPLDAAPLTCAGVTSYKALKLAHARPSDLVAVFGIGGLGHLAVQYARIAGATVVAVDLHQAKLDLAKQLGATYTVDASTSDPAEVIRDLGGCDAAVITAVAPVAFSQAFASLRRGGRAVLVGLPAGGTMPLPIFETVLNGLTVVGSIVGTRLDLAEVFELHQSGLTTVIRETWTLDRINDAMARVENGTIDARIVFDLRDGEAGS